VPLAWITVTRFLGQPELFHGVVSPFQGGDIVYSAGDCRGTSASEWLMCKLLVGWESFFTIIAVICARDPDSR
jgi:hypothetical protein